VPTAREPVNAIKFNLDGDEMRADVLAEAAQEIQHAAARRLQ